MGKCIVDCSRSELEALINEWVVGNNSQRNKRIIRDRLIKGLKIADLAKKYGMSQTRIKTVIRTFRRKVEGE